jgi:hypothetical protein
VLPPDAICATSTAGNFDGSSPTERLTTYTLRGPALAERASKSSADLPWYVRVDLGPGRAITADLKAFFSRPSEVSIIGAADARGDGLDEAFIVLTRGASTGFVGILGIVRGQLFIASTRSGQRDFALGGSVMHQGILQCVGRGASARLIVSGWGSGDGGKSFNWESTTYAWSGMRLYPLSSRNGVFTSLDDPQRAALGAGLSCNGLTGV